MVDGVAVVPVSGVLLSRGDFVGEGAAYTSYSAIVREVGGAAADGAVRGIVLAIGSPGGTVEGVLAAASAIREARAAKPVVAHVGSLAASVAYWLAVQADEIVLADDLSQVGSIGVYTLHMDISRLLAEAGIDVTLIVSGRHKVDGQSTPPITGILRRHGYDHPNGLPLRCTPRHPRREMTQESSWRDTRRRSDTESAGRDSNTEIELMEIVRALARAAARADHRTVLALEPMSPTEADRR